MDELYEKYARYVYCFLLSRCGDANTAEELTQETFLQAFLSLERYDGSCKLPVWLCQIAKHLWYKKLKKQGREAPLTDDMQLCGADTETSFFEKYDVLTVMKRLHALPEPMREVMYLRISGELSFKDIGGILEKSENWARVNYYRGKEKLWKELNDDE